MAALLQSALNYASAATACRDVLGENYYDRLTSLWREKQLQYTWLRAAQGKHADFWRVTGDALDFALETLAIADPALRERLMRLYLSLDPGRCGSPTPAQARSLRRAMC